jgi:phosphatidylserine/phosphatidylglycerophosphate/cardiolipin synthase-like enzyme
MYGPFEYGSDHQRHFYPVIDDALRAAAQRGVIKLMVSDWNTGMPDIAYLKSLAVPPNVQVRVVSLPPASGGFIPFARVIHTNTMKIDDAIAWVGTSNWEGGYMDNSRNLEMVLRDPVLAKRLDALHEQLWDSPYAAPVDLDKSLPSRIRAAPEPHAIGKKNGGHRPPSCLAKQVASYSRGPRRKPPKISDSTNNTRNTTNRILAMPAAPAAMPVKPNSAAISAMTRKTMA